MQDSKIFKEYVSPKRLLNVVKEVSNFHRIQASPMFREAAEHVVKICKRYGLDVSEEFFKEFGSVTAFIGILALVLKDRFGSVDACKADS